VFGFLKKKLKESIDKITSAVEKKEEAIKEAEREIRQHEVPKEEVLKKIEPSLVPEVESIKEEPEGKKSLLSKVKKAITEKKLDESDIEDFVDSLKMSLIESDVAYNVANKICEDLTKNLVGKSVKKKEIEKITKDSLKKSILEIVNVEDFDFLERVKEKKPFLIIFLGFNGSGKTTTIARIGYLLKKNGFKVIFAAADTWRAASIEQLEEHGKKLGIEVVKQKYFSDPAAVVFDAAMHARSTGADVVLADTAGRSHANENLVDELKKIIRVNRPDMKILVLDALTGNDIYEQSKMFNDAVGVDAIILTKADVYDKGGAAISAAYTINKPLIFLGVGQDYDSLEKFDANKLVENLFK